MPTICQNQCFFPSLTSLLPHFPPNLSVFLYHSLSLNILYFKFFAAISCAAFPAYFVAQNTAGSLFDAAISCAASPAYFVAQNTAGLFR
jgi:hypothetical protein